MAMRWRGRGRCAAVALFDESDWRLPRHPLMDASHNATVFEGEEKEEEGGGGLNK